MNTQPRPAPRGGALHCEHMLNPDDAAMLIFNDAQHTPGGLERDPPGAPSGMGPPQLAYQRLDLSRQP